MIRIKALKGTCKGEKVFVVKEIEALRYDQLPARYVNGQGEDGPQFVYYDPITKGLRTLHMNMFLQVGYAYHQQEMENKLAFLRKCGERLKRINEELAKENEGWEGVIEVNI